MYFLTVVICHAVISEPRIEPVLQFPVLVVGSAFSFDIPILVVDNFVNLLFGVEVIEGSVHGFGSL
jgi:hypothetical protein